MAAFTPGPWAVEELKGRIFDALHKPDTEWVEAAIAAAKGGAP